MKAPKTFKYENRLAKTVASHGGMTVGEATRAAQQQLERVRKPTIAHIDVELATIAQMRDLMKSGADADALAKIYGAANRIVATAGLFGLEELGEAAYCLCELVSRFQSSGKFNLMLIEVNTQGLRLLRDPGNHSAADRQAALKGLKQVAASVS